MLIKQKENTDFNPHDPSSIIALLKAREEDSIFMIDFYHHPRNAELRSNFESILSVREMLVSREQIRLLKEEKILYQAGLYTVQNEDAKKYRSEIFIIKWIFNRFIAMFCKRVSQMVSLLEKKFSDATIENETQTIFESYKSIQQTIKSLGVNRPLRLYSIFSSFVKASRDRHQTGLRNLSHLRDKITSFKQGIEYFNIVNGFEAVRPLVTKGISDSPGLAKNPSSTFSKPIKQNTGASDELNKYSKPAKRLASSNIKSRRMSAPGKSENVMSTSKTLSASKQQINLDSYAKNSSVDTLLRVENTNELTLNKFTSTLDQQSLEKNLKVTTQLFETALYETNQKESVPSQDGDKSGDQSPAINITGKTNLKTSTSISTLSLQKESLLKMRRKLSIDISNKKIGCIQFPTASSGSVSPIKLSTPTCSSPKRLLKISSLLHLEKNPVFGLEKPETKKNYYKKVLEELNDSNSSIQKYRNLYYQSYYAKFPHKTSNPMGKNKHTNDSKEAEKKLMDTKTEPSAKESDEPKTDAKQGPMLSNPAGLDRKRPAALQIKTTNKCVEYIEPQSTQTQSATIQCSTSLSQLASPVEFRLLRTKQYSVRMLEMLTSPEKNFRVPEAKTRAVLANQEPSTINLPDQINLQSRSTSLQKQSMEKLPTKVIGNSVSEYMSRCFPDQSQNQSQLIAAPLVRIKIRNRFGSDVTESNVGAEDTRGLQAQSLLIKSPQLNSNQHRKIFDSFLKLKPRNPILNRRATNASTSELY